MAGSSATRIARCTGSSPSRPEAADATPSAIIWVSAASGGTRLTVSAVGSGTGTR